MAGEKLERKYLAHYIDSAFNGTAAAYVRLGVDLEEYTVEMNPDGESSKNILGESRYNLKGYEPQGTVDPYYAYEGDALFAQLKKIIDERATGAATQTTVVDVMLSASGTVTDAYREDVIVVPTSLGGDTSGVSIPFEVHYAGNRTKGTFDMSTKTFTPATDAA